jgi:hypothetical protein
MGRNSRSERRQSAGSGSAGRRAGSRARARASGARGNAPRHRFEMTGAMDATMVAALELEVRRLARRYGALIEDFRVKARRRSG